MITLSRLLVTCALATLLAGCGDIPPIFEDVGVDPHPPTLTLLGIGIQQPGDPLPPVSFVAPSAGLTLRPFDDRARTLALRVSFTDAGGDVSPGGAVTVRDLDGPIAGGLLLPEDLGTSGTFESTLVVPQEAQEGLHRLEIFAEDSLKSRSAKTSFTVTVQLD